MKTFASKIWLAIVFFIPLTVLAQNQRGDKNIEIIIESIVEELDEQVDATLIIEDLEEYAETPLNINSANENELSRLHVLNEIQIQKLLKYVVKFGPVFSIYELNSIDGFTPNILEKIEPFVTFETAVKNKITFRDMFKYGHHQLLSRTSGNIQKPAGNLPDETGNLPFEGNRFRYYTRYQYKTSDLFSAGFTAEKDPGESFFTASNKNGFDYYSGHVSLNPGKVISNITVGDFIVRSGQGLVLWQGYSMQKSVFPIDIIKTNQGIRPSTSVDENRFFRGLTSTFKYKQIEVTGFYSKHKIDGNLSFSEANVPVFTSLQTSGLHRTTNEIEDKNSVNETSAGAILVCRLDNLKLGSTVLYQSFTPGYLPDNQLYNRFRFSGNSNFTGGVDYLFSRGKYQLFGEAAISKSKGKAFLQGAVIQINDQLGFAALIRNFDKSYHALKANPFAEFSNTNNEKGIYFGTRVLPFKYIQISAYSDFYRSEWYNFTTAGPANGWEFLLQADIRLPGKTQFYFRYKNEEKQKKSVDGERYLNTTARTQKFRIHATTNFFENLSLNSRIEYVWYKTENSEHGFMFFEDLKYNSNTLPLLLSARVAYFNTQSYSTRIYAYENDVLYAFSIPAFYGKGWRFYINSKIKIAPKLDCWFKFSNTSWNDRNTISSGYNLIKGNNKTELKIQLRLKI